MCAASDEHCQIVVVDKLDCFSSIRCSVEDGFKKRLDTRLRRMAGRLWNDLAAEAVKTKVIAGKLGLVVVDTDSLCFLLR
jgi:hypothetical protein